MTLAGTLTLAGVALVVVGEAFGWYVELRLRRVLAECERAVVDRAVVEDDGAVADRVVVEAIGIYLDALGRALDDPDLEHAAADMLAAEACGYPVPDW